MQKTPSFGNNYIPDFLRSCFGGIVAFRLLKMSKKLPLHPSLILLFLWFCITKNIGGFLIFVCVVLSHEYGHYFIAKKMGYKLDAFIIAPYGVCLNYKERAFDEKDEIFIALAGPCVNLIVCLAISSLWWAFPDTYNFTYELVSQSFSLALFNLLPCYPLDGGRVAVGFLSQYFQRKIAVKITQICNVVLSVFLLTAFAFSCFTNFNPSLCLCGCFLLFGVFEYRGECKYQPSFAFKKRVKNFSKPFFLNIAGTVSLSQALKRIQPNKLTIYVVVLSNGKSKFVDEKKLQMLALKYPINTTFDEIFK